MNKITTKKIFGTYTLVIYDPGMPPRQLPHTTRFPQKIDLTLAFTNGIIDANSNDRLMHTITIIDNDLRHAKNLISAHWFEGKIEAEEINDKGLIIDSNTYLITNQKQLEQFVSYLKSMTNENALKNKGTAYTPLLHIQTKRENPQLASSIEETGILARGRSLFSCCLGN